MNLDRIFALIPQPERSGTVGAILAVLFLFSMVTSGGGEDPFCGILPWRCTVKASHPESKKSRWRELRVQILAPGRGKGRVCMMENTYQWGSTAWRCIWPSYFTELCDEGYPDREERVDEVETIKHHFYWSDRIERPTCIQIKF